MKENNRIEYKRKLSAKVDVEMVEQLGTGIHRILAYYGKECFHFTENFTRVVFPNLEKEENERLEQGVKQVLTDNQVKIIEAISANPKATITQIAKQVGLGETTIENNLRKLQESEFIKRVGARKTGYWKLTK